METLSTFKEKHLEDWICANLSFLLRDGLVIGRQVGLLGDDGTAVDVMALAKDGSLCVIELKKGEADEGAITQLLRYASLIHSADLKILDRAVAKNHPSCKSMSDLFELKHQKKLLLKQLDELRLFLVARSFSANCEKLARYLNGVHGFNIKLIHFIPFRENYQITFTLKRLRIPGKAIHKAIPASENRSFILSLGANQFFTFDRSAEFGFILVPIESIKDVHWASLNSHDRFFAFDSTGFIGVGFIENSIRPMNMAWLHANCTAETYVLPIRWTIRLPRERACRISSELPDSETIMLIDDNRAQYLIEIITAHCMSHDIMPEENDKLRSEATHSKVSDQGAPFTSRS